MARSKRKPDSSAAAKSQPADRAPLAGVDPIVFLSRALIMALLVARWLLPTEASADGDTLWIVQLWFAAGAFWAWGQLRAGVSRLRFDLFDAALWLLIAGHVVSTAAVFVQGGDRRAAVNLTWEWISLGAGFLLLRQVVRTASDVRRLLLIVISLAVTLASFGVWQHYVVYPQTYREYRRLVDELDQLEKRPAGRQQRANELRLELSAQGVPHDEAGRRRYESRLRDSSEPFGPFALANTFAGFLLVGLFTIFASAGAPLSRRAYAAKLLWTACVLVTAYCLVLTKSRTAFAGLLAGLAAWCVFALLRGGFKFSRKSLYALGGAAAVVILLFVLAAFGRGFDRLVISEAPKSLEYRLQYWTGARGVLNEHPLLGVGPGNFRHHYTKHKVAASSEEIADPHNFVFDLWAGGGLIAVIGLAACIAAALAGAWRSRARGDGDADGSQTADGGGTSPLVLGAAGAFALASFAGLFSGTGFLDERLWMLGFGWGAIYALLSRVAPIAAYSRAPLAAGVVALFVHLSGAGGIEMPAVVQLSLLLVAILTANFARHETPQTTTSPRSVIAWAVACGVLFVACLLTSTLPATSRRTAIAAGDAAMMLQQDLASAERSFAEAGEQDPWSQSPWERRAELHFVRWQNQRGDDAHFERAVEAMRRAIEINPLRSSAHRQLGEMWLAKFGASQKREDAAAAADAFAAACERYQNDATLRVSLADALAKSGRPDDARREARRALELDDVNRSYSHTDRYLPDRTLDQLRRIVNPDAPRQ